MTPIRWTGLIIAMIGILCLIFDISCATDLVILGVFTFFVFSEPADHQAKICLTNQDKK